MSTTLIGFLGRGPLVTEDGNRKPYQEAQYGFDGWTSDIVRFFLHAALEWMRDGRNPPDRLIVLGTSGSMWDGMLESLCKHDDRAKQSRLDDLCLELVDRVDHQSVAQDYMPAIESELSEALNIEVHAVLIPAGKNEAEQAKILDAIQQFVQQGDQVYLDVTHGYRHQPMLALGAAVFLSQFRGAYVREILYGANDMRDGGPVAPVVSLSWLLELLDWANCGRQLRNGGGLASLPKMIQDKSLGTSLSEAAFLFSTNQVHQAGDKAKECKSTLASIQNDAILDLIRPEVDNLLDGMAGCQRNAKGIVSMARQALNEQDFVRTAIFLNESVNKHSAQLDEQKVDEIKGLRHALCHAIRMPNGVRPETQQVITKALRSRTQMHKTLESELEWLEAHV